MFSKNKTSSGLLVWDSVKTNKSLEKKLKYIHIIIWKKVLKIPSEEVQLSKNLHEKLINAICLKWLKERKISNCCISLSIKTLNWTSLLSIHAALKQSSQDLL